MRLQNRCITVVIELCVAQFWSEILLCLKLPLRASLILKLGQIATQLAQLPLLFFRIFVILITIVTTIIIITITIIIIIITIICIIISTFSR